MAQKWHTAFLMCHFIVDKILANMLSFSQVNRYWSPITKNKII